MPPVLQRLGDAYCFYSSFMRCVLPNTCYCDERCHGNLQVCRRVLVPGTATAATATWRLVIRSRTRTPATSVNHTGSTWRASPAQPKALSSAPCCMFLCHRRSDGSWRIYKSGALLETNVGSEPWQFSFTFCCLATTFYGWSDGQWRGKMSRRARNVLRPIRMCGPQICGGAVQPNSLTNRKCGHQQRMFLLHTMIMALCLPFFKIEDGVDKLHLSEKNQFSCFLFCQVMQIH